MQAVERLDVAAHRFAGLSRAGEFHHFFLNHGVVQRAGERRTVVARGGHLEGNSARDEAFAVWLIIEVGGRGGHVHRRFFEVCAGNGHDVRGPGAQRGCAAHGVELKDRCVLRAECHARAAKHPVEFARGIVEEERLAVFHVDNHVVGHHVACLDFSHFHNFAGFLVDAADVVVLVARLVVFHQIDADEHALAVAADGEVTLVGVKSRAEALHGTRCGVYHGEPVVGVVAADGKDFLRDGVVGEGAGGAFSVRG